MNQFNTNWTDEKFSRVMELRSEGITTAEIARRIGFTKSAVCGKIYRHRPVVVVSHMTPATKAMMALKPSDCRWPHGHPDETDFHFCGARRHKLLPYCAHHAAIAYERPKEMTI